MAAALEPEPLPVEDDEPAEDEPDDEPESEEELLELDSFVDELDDSLVEAPESPDDDLPAAAEAADDLDDESRLSLR